jgi:CRP/FNR family cyclic AMP-dependent transcriptional regulator
MTNSLHTRVLSHSFLARMKPEYLELLASGATEVTFKPDQIVFREGEPASQFYLIETGQIALEAHQLGDGTVLVETLGPGEVLGWSWLFAPFVWHFQARAIEPTKAIALNAAHLLIAAEQDHPFGYELMKRVAQIVIHRLQATRRQLLNERFETALEG